MKKLQMKFYLRHPEAAQAGSGEPQRRVKLCEAKFDPEGSKGISAAKMLALARIF